MATLNLGRIKPVFRDAYDASTAYVVDDIVTSGNETFICILASTGNATSNATYWTKLAAKGTDGTNGTDVGTVITTQGDILYRDGSGLQRLAKGTAAQQLAMNAGATAPEWISASSDYVKLGTGSVSAGASIEFDGLFTSDYKVYKFFWWNYTCSTTSEYRAIRYKTTGSYTVQTADYSAATAVGYVDYNNGLAVHGKGGYNKTSMYVGRTLNASNANRPYTAEITLYNPQATTLMKFCEWNCTNDENTSGHIYQHGAGGGLWHGGNDAITGIQFLPTGGTMTATVDMYGIK